MIVLNLSEVSMSFGTDVILNKITFGLNGGDRLGVVGVNGAGKSLLFKIISGKVRCDSGSVNFSKDLKVAYLEQNASFESKNPIFDEMLLAFPQLVKDEERLEWLQNEMLSFSEENEETHMRLAAEYARLEESFRKNGGYEYKSRIQSMLCAIGFEKERQNLSIDTLSGGQKTRLALVRTLLSEPDILMLDEPTNHLDIPSVEWLENYLAGYKKTLLVISHDRYFLDKVTNKTFEIENTEGKLYNLPYSGFVKQKEKDREIDERHYKNQRREIERMEAFIENQRRWNRERNIIAAESRMKAIERMDKLEKPKDLPESIKMSFSAGAHELLSDNILDVKGLSKSYGKKTLFKDISFILHSRERMFIFGENGVGKSTLLKILCGKLMQDSGSFEYINKIKIGYYDQEHQGLNPSNTVLDELWNEYPDKKQSEIRGALARFLFKAEDVFKEVSVLSGGEKARLTFAKMMLEDLNLLILDEPTNHLDAASREVLEDAILGYNGTVIAVSHDRYFIKKLATRILELRTDGYMDYRGGYEDFCEYRKKTAAEAVAGNSGNEAGNSITDNQGSGKAEYIRTKQEKSRRRKAEKQQAEAEKAIAECEERLKEIDAEMEKAGSDYVKTAKLYEEQNSLHARLDELYLQWDEATADLSDE